MLFTLHTHIGGSRDLQSSKHVKQKKSPMVRMLRTTMIQSISVRLRVLELCTSDFKCMWCHELGIHWTRSFITTSMFCDAVPKKNLVLGS